MSDVYSCVSPSSTGCLRFTERRGKKTVRFDGGTMVGGPQDDWSWEADRQGSQDSATKDSGIDTSSTFTSSEDSNRGDLPKVRDFWEGLFTEINFYYYTLAFIHTFTYILYTSMHLLYTF